MYPIINVGDREDVDSRKRYAWIAGAEKIADVMSKDIKDNVWKEVILKWADDINLVSGYDEDLLKLKKMFDNFIDKI